jgi:hypothetical protein
VDDLRFARRVEVGIEVGHIGRMGMIWVLRGLINLLKERDENAAYVAGKLV